MDTETLQTVRVPAPRRRRRGLRALVLVLAGVLGLATGALVYLDTEMDRVGPIASLAPGAAGPENLLIVGSDSREDLPPDLEGSFGDFAGARADVIIVAHVADGRPQMLSLPRDLKVEVPGEGTDKINAAYAYGGPDLLVRTVSENTGIPVHRYLEIDFGGFAAIVNALGGIELDFPHPARDLKSGLSVEEPGRQTVDGATALAYVRSRSYQELQGGEWVDVRTGDIERTGRQREVLAAIAEKITDPSGLIRAPSAMAAVARQVTVDQDTRAWHLAWFALGFRTGGEAETVSLPVVGSSEGGVSYVVADQPQADEVVAAFIQGRPLPVEPIGE